MGVIGVLVLLGAPPQSAPLVQVGQAATVPELRAMLNRWSKSQDEATVRAFLWGSILYDGNRSRKAAFPPSLVDTGERMTKLPLKDESSRVLQAWWREAIGSRYAVPNFKDAQVQQWITVTENGKKVREPVWYSPSEFREAAAIKATKERLMRTASRNDAVILYRIWHANAPSTVSDAEIANLATDAASPFQVYGIAELAIREEQRGKPGPWTRRWSQIKARRPNDLTRESLVQREREALRDKR